MKIRIDDEYLKEEGREEISSEFTKSDDYYKKTNNNEFTVEIQYLEEGMDGNSYSMGEEDDSDGNENNISKSNINYNSNDDNYISNSGDKYKEYDKFCYDQEINYDYSYEDEIKYEEHLNFSDKEKIDNNEYENISLNKELNYDNDYEIISKIEQSFENKFDEKNEENKSNIRIDNINLYEKNEANIRIEDVNLYEKNESSNRVDNMNSYEENEGNIRIEDVNLYEKNESSNRIDDMNLYEENEANIRIEDVISYEKNKSNSKIDDMNLYGNMHNDNEFKASNDYFDNYDSTSSGYNNDSSKSNYGNIYGDDCKSNGEIRVSVKLGDKNGIEIKSAKINLYELNGICPKLYKSKLTDCNGEVIFSDLENGCYRVISLVDRRFFEKPIYITWNEVIIDDSVKEAYICVVNRIKQSCLKR